MALTPWNRQEEWYQQMINASTGNYLPSISAQDAGKVMTVENDGSWGVENVPQELPAVETTDKDKYLHTNASTGAVEWADAPNELPAVAAVDEGKVLTVNNSGVWGAQEPIGKKFIVTCTPSDETFTFGQMDKTVGEIKQAVDAGMEVWFQMTFNQNLTGLYVCNGIDHYPNATFGYVFVAMFVLSFGDNAYLARLTTSSNSEDSTVWVSTIFPLTPAT